LPTVILLLKITGAAADAIALTQKGYIKICFIGMQPELTNQSVLIISQKKLLCLLRLNEIIILADHEITCFQINYNTGIAY